jgi:hypothetical protein
MVKQWIIRHHTHHFLLLHLKVMIYNEAFRDFPNKPRFGGALFIQDLPSVLGYSQN